MSFSSLLSLAVLASLAGTAAAGTFDPDGARGASVPGHYGDLRTGESVLVARDYMPWNGDVVPYFTAAGANVDVVLVADLDATDLSQYCLVYITAGTTQPGDGTANTLQAMMPLLETYVADGGDLVFFTGTWGATYTAPGGLTTLEFAQNENYIDVQHPIAAGIPNPFSGSGASHDIFMTLPGGAGVITSMADGTPTGVEYPLGAGHCIVMGQPIECYLEGGSCGTENFPHMEQIFVNTVGYALSIADCGGTVDAVEGPASIALRGNHPNPFNPGTTIAWETAETGSATLSVWNLAGERVATLVDGPVSAGLHETAFDAGALPSGVYFSRLEAAGQVRVERMLLVK